MAKAKKKNKAGEGLLMGRAPAINPSSKLTQEYVTKIYGKRAVLVDHDVVEIAPNKPYEKDLQTGACVVPVAPALSSESLIAEANVGAPPLKILSVEDFRKC